MRLALVALVACGPEPNPTTDAGGTPDAAVDAHDVERRMPDDILAWVRDFDRGTTTNYDYEYRLLCGWDVPPA